MNSAIIPKRGRFRPKDRLIYIKQAVLSLFRNKRRSMSMIAGLVLGISILSGISIYSTVLMSNVYESIIEGTPYEIRMDFGETLTESRLETYRQTFAAHEWVSDAQLLYGNARTVIETTGTSTSMYSLGNLDATVTAEYNNENYTGSQGVIFSLEFYFSEIGANIRENLITDRNPDMYDPYSPDYLGVLISEKLAESAKLRKGNRLSQIRLAISAEDLDDPNYPFVERKIKEIVTLENITIAGILSAGDSASAGLFSEALEFAGGVGGEIFIPEDLLINAGKSSFLQSLNENQMRFCAVKIDETKFDLANPTGVSSQINKLINEFEADLTLIGSNMVQDKLIPFQILSIFIFIFDGVLTIPVAILSLYLLSFGIDISLHERRYQVGILKTQGASPKQIKRKILMEVLLLAILGLIIGYVIAVMSAWVIGTSVGFMKWSDTALDELPDFLRLLIFVDFNALFVVGGLIIVILFFMVNGKANKFISMEITETVRRVEDLKKENFLKRNNLDVIFFGIGLFVLFLVFLQEIGISINLGPATILLALLGPPFFWIGGSAVVSRVAVWIPSKADPIIRRIGFLKDVSLLIKGNVFRKSGDIPRLALIISLTVSFACLAAVQGTSGENHKLRMITHEIGADIAVTTGINISSLAISDLSNSSDDITEVMAITTTAGILRNDPVVIQSVDANLFDTVGIWQSDAIPAGGEIKTEQDLMSALIDDPYGCVMGSNLLNQIGGKVGDNISLEILTYYLSGNFSFFSVNISEFTSFLDFFEYGYIARNVTIRGEFNNAPRGIGSSDMIIDHKLLNSLINFTSLSPFLEMLNITFIDELIPQNAVIASNYLIKVKKEADVEIIRTSLLEGEGVISVKTLKGEVKKANEIKQMDYGIPGLLTADFVISLVAATLATFIFMSILMDSRKKEFAILRSYGASQRQIYKVVFSETIVLLLTSVIWGFFVGIGLSILFNPFFEFMDVFITPLSIIAAGGSAIKRLLIFDWLSLLSSMIVTFLAMLIATFLSVYGAAKAKISTEVREL